MSTKIWLSPPHMGGSEEKYVREAFETNWIAPLGPNVDGFEQVLSDNLDGYHVAALGSGTAAIHLALVLLGVQPGDEVLVSDFTFIGTVNPIIYQGAVPVFIDSEMSTWNMDPHLLEEAIADRIKHHRKPKAIIYVDIYGMPANIEAIQEVAGRYDIPLIEDAAEALGSRYGGRPCGTFGAIGTLSFNGNKIITTSGGGALVSRDPGTAAQARFLASQAKENTLHFEHRHTGYNYRLSNVLAGIGRGQMEVLEERVEAHRRINRHYRGQLADIQGISFQSEPDSRFFSNFWLTAAIVDRDDNQFTQASMIGSMGEDNIDSRPVMKPMHMQSVYRHHPAYLRGVSAFLYRHGLCLPSGSNLTDGDLERIVGRIRLAAGK